jgi:hypothetical protein
MVDLFNLNEREERKKTNEMERKLNEEKERLAQERKQFHLHQAKLKQSETAFNAQQKRIQLIINVVENHDNINIDDEKVFNEKFFNSKRTL